MSGVSGPMSQPGAADANQTGAADAPKLTAAEAKALAAKDLQAIDGMYKDTLAKIHSGNLTPAQAAALVKEEVGRLELLRADVPTLQAAVKAGSLSMTQLDGINQALAKTLVTLQKAVAVAMLSRREDGSPISTEHKANLFFIGTALTAYIVAMMSCVNTMKQNKKLMGDQQVQMRNLERSTVKDVAEQIQQRGEDQRDKAMTMGWFQLAGGMAGLIGGGMAAAGGNDPNKPGRMMMGQFGKSMSESAPGLFGGMGQMATAHYETDITGHQAQEEVLKDALNQVGQTKQKMAQQYDSDNDQINQITRAMVDNATNMLRVGYINIH